MATEDVVKVIKTEIERLSLAVMILEANAPAVSQPRSKVPAVPVNEVQAVPAKKVGRPLGSKTVKPEQKTAHPLKGRKLSPAASKNVVAAIRKRAAKKRAAKSATVNTTTKKAKPMSSAAGLQRSAVAS